MLTNLAPFALLTVDNNEPLAGVVTDYVVERSIVDQVGRCELKIAAGNELGITKGSEIVLELGDTMYNRRWKVFEGTAEQPDANPNIIVSAYDLTRDIATTEIDEPASAKDRAMADWVIELLAKLPSGLPATQLDLPGRLGRTLFSKGLFASTVKAWETADTLTISAALARLADRYETEKYFGERLAYYIDRDGSFVWSGWTDSGIDTHRVVYGENLIHLDVAPSRDDRHDDPHTFEMLPSPWLWPGDTFAFVDREIDPRLDFARWRADSVTHSRRGNVTRTFAYARMGLA